VIAENAGHADNYRGHENYKSEDDDHDAPR
jgi:hypothetical protein